VVLRGKIANASRLTCGPPADPLRDDPATTQSEINEHVDGVRWSFLYCDICRRKRSAYCHRSLVDADVAPASRCEGSSSKLPNGGEAEASDAGHEVELGRVGQSHLDRDDAASADVDVVFIEDLRDGS